MAGDSFTRIRLAAQVRHQGILLLREPGPLIGYTVMPLLLIAVLRPMFQAIDHLHAASTLTGTGQAAAGMAVMFSIFAMKAVGASMLEERTWNTWDRLRATPAHSGQLLLGKALPLLVTLIAQQFFLFGFAITMFGLRPASNWWALVGTTVVWSTCVLLLGTAASSLIRSPAQLSACGDVAAVLTTILAGALVPTTLLPGWLQHLGPVSPGHWAMRGYEAALIDGNAKAIVGPLAALAVFGALGIGLGALFSHRSGG